MADPFTGSFRSDSFLLTSGVLVLRTPFLFSFPGVLLCRYHKGRRNARILRRRPLRQIESVLSLAGYFSAAWCANGCSADLKSAVSRICNPPPVRRSDSLPTGSRRYGRLQVCATTEICPSQCPTRNHSRAFATASASNCRYSALAILFASR